MKRHASTLLVLAGVLGALSFSAEAASLSSLQRKILMDETEQEAAYQSILAHEAKRALVLQAKLAEHRDRLAAHRAGRALLSEAEHDRLVKQTELYERHLRELATEGREEKLEKVREAREFHAMHQQRDTADLGGATGF